MAQAHTMEHYLATKRNEARTHATTRMDLGSIALSGRSQTQTVWLHLHAMSRRGTSTETEGRLAVWEEPGGNECLLGVTDFSPR